ncbi:Allantoinase [Aminobacter sp. MSH1]|uniref:dihydroorotase n=1 Tax=Aminobacter sp. MSH1 TaxID=374606 RepID=UPI000D3ACFE3|nr:amidohydrolase family protein [Aminobacter sp. MSH1]AWC21251.1 Allantoinase [Aminobacter sp. MSH1]
MYKYDLSVNNGTVILSDGSSASVNLGVKEGKIAAISSEVILAETMIDAKDKTVIPGLVDQHFHCWWGYGVETHEISTRAAARGGVTTLVEMPLDKPATITSELLRVKLEQIGDQYHVDYATIGGYCPDRPDEVHAMVRAGVVAIKIFTGDVAPPGMFPGTPDGELLDLMRRVKKENVTLMVHCENAGIVEAETARVRAEGKAGPSAWDEARPWFAEVDAVQRIAILAKVTGARVIVVHISTPEAVDVVTAARREGVDIWAETLPHQLCLDLGSGGEDARLKWNPPPRSRAAVDGLWRRLAAGEIHSIASDHAPLTKIAGADIWNQNPGAGNVLETMLSVVATEAIYHRGVGLANLVEAMSSTPAKILGLYPRKGSIQVGADADLVVLETNGSRIIDGQALEFYDQTAKWSPYHGREVKVFPLRTILRGRTVYADGEVIGPLGYGEYITVAPSKT